MNEYCKGCGVQLNRTDVDAIGYAHPSNKEQICQRCYQMTHFNKVPTTHLTNDEYKTLLNTIVAKKKTIVWVIDIFDFSGSYHDYIEQVLQGVEVIIVANKVDLLPKSVNKDKLEKWIVDSLSTKLNIVDVVITSATKIHNIDCIIESLYKVDATEAYFIGTTNVGKSTIINKFIRAVDSSKKEFLTTSYYSGTTLGLIKIEVNNNLTIFDTPGIINEQNIANKLTKESLKIVVPNKEIRPTTFQLKAQQTLFMTGLVQLDFEVGSEASFTTYCSNSIEVHRTNMRNAEEIRAKHFGHKLLQVPNQIEALNFKNTKIVTLEFSQDCDIIISGIGFVAVKNVTSTMQVRVVLEETMHVEMRKNLI